MKHMTGTFRSSHDGFEIFRQTWLPDGPIHRVIVIQHGFGEHSGRYGNILQTFGETGTALYALDSRGHGRTGGKRGHVEQFQMYVDDLADLISLARKESGKEKVILLGHSLGGVIALQYAIQATHQEILQALVVSSPGLMIQMDLAKTVKKAMGAVLARFFPDTTVDANLDLKFLSHDAAVIDAYKADPLVHGKVSFQMATNLFNIGKVIYEKIGVLKIPVYIFHGVADGIVSSRGSELLFEKLTTPDRTLKLYPDLFHETMNEASPAKEQVLSDLKIWVLERS
ncbi:MAG: alpha/beta hydrolase [Spirochaetales bacterium]|nr:alpha/beta hydrolase [Spirochaetales bacterium]